MPTNFIQFFNSKIKLSFSQLYLSFRVQTNHVLSESTCKKILLTTLHLHLHLLLFTFTTIYCLFVSWDFCRNPTQNIASCAYESISKINVTISTLYHHQVTNKHDLQNSQVGVSKLPITNAVYVLPRRLLHFKCCFSGELHPLCVLAPLEREKGGVRSRVLMEIRDSFKR